MADADPALLATWEDEIAQRDERSARLAAWTTDHELLAQVVDALAVLHAQYVKFHVKPGTHVPRPRFVPRPGQEDPNKPKQVSPRDLARRLMGR